MSFPWWRYQVTFEDGEVIDWTATGGTPTDGLAELLSDWLDRGSDFGKAIHTHGDVTNVKYLHCDTFGVDPASDEILLMEARQAGVG
jgi:hypothetical protein